MITHYNAEGVLAVDTHYLRPRLDASHLMIRDGQDHHRLWNEL